MAPPRHKRAKPPSPARRLIRRSVPLATAVTLASSAAALAWPHYETSTTSAASTPEATQPVVDPGDWRSRERAISRSEERVTLEKKPEPKPEPKPKPKPDPKPEVVDHLFMTAPLNVWSGPGESFTLIDVLPVGTRIGVTGETQGGWAEVVLDGQARWVNADYLSETKPKPEPPEPQGLSSAPCDSGSDVESGLSANAISVHRAVCAEFPQVEEYGGLRPGDDGEHGTGHALDIMVYEDSATGDAIAEFVRAHYEELGVTEVIWSQRIWTAERSSEGWRWMEDRGSTTANHYDHVHVTVS